MNDWTDELLSNCDRFEEALTAITICAGKAHSDQCENADWETIANLHGDGRLVSKRSGN